MVGRKGKEAEGRIEIEIERRMMDKAEERVEYEANRIMRNEVK